jgi:RNA polymerase sigma factor (TIGR02999 family)
LSAGPNFGIVGRMSDVTRLLELADQGDGQAAADLLPLVYDELRKLAAARLADEKAGQTLQPTALVHEAFLRLVPGAAAGRFNGRAHFFGAAAEAMRRILVEAARRRAALKRGGGLARDPLAEAEIAAPEPDDDLLALDEALAKLAETDPTAASLVNLRYFAGLTGEQAAATLGLSDRTADRTWSYARAWLRKRIDVG